MAVVMKNLQEFINSLPPDTTMLDNQVAGHSFRDGKNSIGMLKQKDGKILKHAAKEREIDFYENVFYNNFYDQTLSDMKQLIPQYYGTRTLQINQKDSQFMVLENMTKGMKQPCVMDIKIGKITWDCFATPEKIESEKSKYVNTKNELGLSLPGFEMYDLNTNTLLKFGKEYGKILDGDTFKHSIKLFLNGTKSMNQHLVLQILGQLWRILYWCRTQRKLLIFSSSILLAYDAHRLRKCYKIQDKTSHKPSAATANTINNIQNSRKRVLYLLDQSPSTRLSNHKAYRRKSVTEKIWHNNFTQIKFNRNSLTEKELLILKEEYFAILEQNVTNGKECVQYGVNHDWVKVKMIDFAHVFPSNNKLDDNYLEGIEMLVKIFQDFLLESFCY